MHPVFKFLVGTWFICSTNFPLWLKGDKSDPTFNYAYHKKTNKLNDEVIYVKKGSQRSIKGVDSYRVEDSSFVWRGNWILKLARSKWRIVKIDPENKWAVIYFSKTIFTPEGIDIICRSKDLGDLEISRIKNDLMKDDNLKKLVPSMKELYNNNLPQ